MSKKIKLNKEIITNLQAKEVTGGVIQESQGPHYCTIKFKSFDVECGWSQGTGDYDDVATGSQYC